MDEYYFDLWDYVAIIGSDLKGTVIGTATIFDNGMPKLLYVIELEKGFINVDLRAYVSRYLVHPDNMVREYKEA